MPSLPPFTRTCARLMNSHLQEREKREKEMSFPCAVSVSPTHETLFPLLFTCASCSPAHFAVQPFLACTLDAPLLSLSLPLCLLCLFAASRSLLPDQSTIPSVSLFSLSCQTQQQRGRKKGSDTREADYDVFIIVFPPDSSHSRLSG